MSAQVGGVRAGVPRGAFAAILRNEVRLAVRLPLGLFLGLVLPVVLLFLFSGLPKFNTPQTFLHGGTEFGLYVPILMCFAMAAVGLWSLPRPLAMARDKGVLRRLSTTPVPPSWLLGAQLVVAFAIAVLALAILLVGSATLLHYRIAADASIVGVVVTALLGMAALFALGLAVTAVAPNSNVAYVFGAVLFFGCLFFAGMWLPRALMPPTLVHIGNLTPLSVAAQAFGAALGGSFPAAWMLVVLAAYAVVFSAFAVRFFRWQ